MDHVAMENSQGWIASLGATFGVVLYGGAEIIRRILNKGPKDDPVILQMQADIAALSKTVGAVATQLDYFIEGHHDDIKNHHDELQKAVARIGKIERNGNGKKK